MSTLQKAILSGSLITLIFSLMGVSILEGGDNRLVIQGSTTVLPIAQRCAEVFIERYKGVDISVRGGGSGVGIAALIDGICDIAISSRSIKDKESKEALEKGSDPIGHTIAMDGIAVIVHPSNPISKLSLSQLKDIYTGKISNWKELGGKNRRIVVVSRDVASGTFESFSELALKKEKVRPDALLQASNAAVVSTVKRTKGAIGYVGFGYVRRGVKALSIDGVLPSVETVLKGTYPISRPLFMYTNGKPEGLVKDFIEFVLSKEGQRIVKEQGFIPIKN